MGDGQCNLFYFLELVDLVAIPLLLACHRTPPPKKCTCKPTATMLRRRLMRSSYEVPSQTTDAQQLLSLPKAAEGRCFLVSILCLARIIRYYVIHLMPWKI